MTSRWRHSDSDSCRCIRAALWVAATDATVSSFAAIRGMTRSPRRWRILRRYCRCRPQERTLCVRSPLLRRHRCHRRRLRHPQQPQSADPGRRCGVGSLWPLQHNDRRRTVLPQSCRHAIRRRPPTRRPATDGGLRCSCKSPWTRRCRPAAAAPSSRRGTAPAGAGSQRRRKICPLCWDPRHTTFAAGPVALLLRVRRDAGPWCSQEAIQAQPFEFAALQQCSMNEIIG